MEHAITFLTCLSALFFVLWICTAISYKDQKAKLNNLANRYDKLYVENDRLSKEYKYFVVSAQNDMLNFAISIKLSQLLRQISKNFFHEILMVRSFGKKLL
jgi:hypothetical protein